MRRIIIHKLWPKYNGIVMATQAQAKDLTMTEFENTSANQEVFDSQMFKVLVKDDGSALFNNNKRIQELEEKLCQHQRRKLRKTREDWQRQPKWTSAQPSGAHQDRNKDDN